MDKRIMDGEVVLTPFECSDIGDVSNEHEDLSEVLKEFVGKKVRVTIEVIE